MRYKLILAIAMAIVFVVIGISVVIFRARQDTVDTQLDQIRQELAKATEDIADLRSTVDEHEAQLMPVADKYQVEGLVKQSLQYIVTADFRGLYESMSPNYRSNATYENFAFFFMAGTGRVFRDSAAEDWEITDISVRLDGDWAFASYTLREDGSVRLRTGSIGLEDLYRKIDGEWYDVAEDPRDPGYNDEDLPKYMRRNSNQSRDIGPAPAPSLR